MSVEIPYVTIGFGAVGVPRKDVIECRVHLGGTKEVSSFEVLLQNWDKQYSPGGATPIVEGVDGYIKIGRTADPPQVLTCRVEKVQYLSSPTEHYVRVSGRCWGEKLFRRVVTKTYENMKGEDIVKDLLDSYAGLSHERDSVELVEDTDTTYTKLEYDNTPVWDILQYIAESADKNGVIGFDFRVAPDGKFEFFPKNSKTSPVSLSEKIEDSEYRKDIHRIRNKIYVYGTAEKPFPLDKDGQSWSDTLTEDLTVSEGTGPGGSDELVHDVYGKWSVLTGSTDLDLDTANRYAGAKSVKVVESAYMYYTAAAFKFNAGKELNADEYPQVIFAVYIDDNHHQTGDLKVKDINGKYASKRLSFTKQNEWEKVVIPWGSHNAEQWDYIDAGFDWTKIEWVGVAVDQKYSGYGSWWIDMFYFGYGRWSATEEDTNSQNNYGLRELVEVDEELTGDDACERRAKALLNHLKDPAEYLVVKSTVLDYGSTPILPGDKIHVSLPNENVDSDFRVESVEYRADAKNQTLEVSLELGKAPPLLADYLYGLRSTTVTVEKLSRTKLGRFKIPTVTGAGVGIHVRGHEAGDEAGNPWPSPSTGGWDRITGWITPNYVGPYSDAPAITNFRTKNVSGDLAVNHQFNPTDDGYGVLGVQSKRWSEAHLMYLFVSGFARLNQLNIGSYEGDQVVITPGRVLQNVFADASIITSGQFGLGRMPRGDAGKFLRAYGADFDPMYAFIDVADIPGLPASKITSGQFPLARMPRGTAGYVLEAQGAGYDPMYVNPNGRYLPASHSHSHASLTGIGPDDHHARDHDHAGETLNPNTINVNNLNVAVGVNCANWQAQDILFENDFRITEAEKLGLGEGLAFLNPKGRVLMLLDGEGNLKVRGKIGRLVWSEEDSSQNA